MAIQRVQKKIDWSRKDLTRHKTIQKTFQGRPGLDELVAQGELSGRPIPLGAYLSLKLIVRNLRKMRERAHLSLADVSRKSGMDKAMLSRLETGRVPNPGIETLVRYVNALGKDIEWRFVEAPARKRKRREPV